MSDIFLSYSSEDRTRISLLVRALEARHWTVWWDRTIPPGKTWDQVIEAELSRAKCVVVLWSKSSVDSEWVRTEADEAKARSVLVPACLDDVRIPLAFRRVQAARLVNWNGSADDIEFQGFCQAIADIIGSREVAKAEAAEITEDKRRTEEAEPRLIAEKRKADEAVRARLAEEKRKAEEAERARLAAEKRKAEEAERARLAEEKRKAEEAERARIAAEKRKADEAERAQVADPPTPGDGGSTRIIAAIGFLVLMALILYGTFTTSNTP